MSREADEFPEAHRISVETAISFEDAKSLWLALGDKAAEVAVHCSRNAISPRDVLAGMSDVETRVAGVDLGFLDLGSAGAGAVDRADEASHAAIRHGRRIGKQETIRALAALAGVGSIVRRREPDPHPQLLIHAEAAKLRAAEKRARRAEKRRAER